MATDDDAWSLALAPLSVTAIALAGRTNRQLRRASRNVLLLVYQDEHVQLMALRWRSRSLCPLFRDMNGDAPRGSTGRPIFVLIQYYWWGDHHTSSKPYKPAFPISLIPGGSTNLSKEFFICFTTLLGSTVSGGGRCLFIQPDFHAS